VRPLLCLHQFNFCLKMVFMCQKDSYLQEFSSKVVSVTNADDKIEVICEDTVLFPEGMLF
jgi:hypothetical protein